MVGKNKSSVHTVTCKSECGFIKLGANQQNKRGGGGGGGGRGSKSLIIYSDAGYAGLI